MKRLTRKALRQEAERLGATNLLSGDIYHYENDLYYLTHMECNPLAEGMESTIGMLRIAYPSIDGSKSYHDQLAFSAGAFGNNGRIDEIHFLDSDYNEVHSIFVYYTTK